MSFFRKSHPGFRYQAAGGVRQVVLQTGEQLSRLHDLDPKEWIVLSCPTTGHEMEDESLKAIDPNGDGRIRVREIRETIIWLESAVSSLSILESGCDLIQLSDIREETETGQGILNSIRHLQSLLGSEDEDFDLERLKRGKVVLQSAPLNGEGVITREATEDEAVRELIDDILATVGGTPTSRGVEGVNEADLESFLAACASFQTWHEEGSSPEAAERLFPFGEQTEAAFAALLAVEEKIDDWFEASATFAYAPDLVERILHLEPLADRPLATIDGNGELPLAGGWNPAWRQRIEQFVEKVFPGEKEPPVSLTADHWQDLREMLKPYRTWRTNQPGSLVSGLGIEQVNVCLEAEDLQGRLRALLAEDRELEDEIHGVGQVERLLRLKKDFWEFLHNFVNFDAFYNLHSQAIFQVGVLYLDGRSFHLCLPVQDPKSHSAMAQNSGLFLAYCQLSRHDREGMPTIAVAVTDGDGRRLMVGKHGIFYDRDDLEWDARITLMVKNPINLRQAILEPFRRMGLLVVSQIEKLSAAREKSMQSRIVGGISEGEKSAAAIETLPVGEGQAERHGMGAGGLLAGGGFAFAAIASSLAFLSSTMATINPVYILYGLFVFLLLIIIPTALLGWMKLRARDIGPLLEAGGWAVNAHMRLTHALGQRLTRLARRK